jgi:hypothetical protein
MASINPAARFAPGRGSLPLALFGAKRALVVAPAVAFADFALRTTASMAAFAVLAAIAFSEPRQRLARAPSAKPRA